MSERAKAFEALAALVEYLRGPEGCPWDRQQTHESLLPYLLEETYEVVAALEDWAENPHKLREELGDLLLHVLLHSVIAAERQAFTITDVILGLHDKLVRRHPHVFGDEKADGPQEVSQIWEHVKKAERSAGERDQSPPPSLLGDVPEGLPPSARAYELQQRAASVGFDWVDPLTALTKVREEIQELADALAAGDETAIGEEAGDAMFALINVIRLAGFHPDAVLSAANKKFTHRFQLLELEARKLGRKLADMTLDEMDSIWNRTKSSNYDGKS